MSETRRWTLHGDSAGPFSLCVAGTDYCEPCFQQKANVAIYINTPVVPESALLAAQQERDDALNWIKAERRDCGCTDRILAHIEKEKP